MPDADARRHAETRRRFEDVESKLNEVHSEVFTLWGIIEEQRRKMKTLQKKVAALTRARYASRSHKRR